MEIKIRSVKIERRDVSTRMPFQYGIATMTHLPHVFIRIEAFFSGQTVRGISADHLPPKWFTKDPDKDPLDEIDDMLLVINKAGEFACSIHSTSVFSYWHELYRLQNNWASQNNIPLLLAHFGTSLIERALIDAFCRFRNETFKKLLRSNAFGIDWDDLRPELTGLEPKNLFSKRSLSSVMIRHTVGLADPLWESDILEEDRLSDGLPQSLESCIRFYGLSHFKIKVTGQRGQDHQRLESIERLFKQIDLQNFAFSLDGNEQFQDVASFRAFWETLHRDERMRSFFNHLLFVEQPFHRDIALTKEIGMGLRSWENAPPVIIDESDASLDSLPLALELGYSGTSHKNCKGVFKGILNRATINAKNLQEGKERYLMSGEDLANIGPVANHQDLVVQAALGIHSVERNGHHYFKGLSLFDESIQSNAQKGFPKLYTRDQRDYIRLNVKEGKLDIEDLNSKHFGVDSTLLDLPSSI